MSYGGANRSRCTTIGEAETAVCGRPSRNDRTPFGTPGSMTTVNASEGSTPHRSITSDLKFLGGLFFCSLVVTTSTVWFAEPRHGMFDTFGDVLWWWVVTSTTVGYGDVVPSSPIGRLAGVVAIVVGIYGYTHAISLILQRVQARLEREERGLGAVDSRNHVLIFEYTAFADELIREIDSDRLLEGREVVIAGALVDRKPYDQHHFIRGEPISPDTQSRANTADAGVIFVFANSRFTEPDLKTLHVASRIMRRNERARIYVELEDPDHPLLDELPRPVHVMPTRELLESSLRHEHLDMERFELSEKAIHTEKMPAPDV